MKRKIFLFFGAVISVLGVNLNSNLKCNGVCTGCNYSCIPGLFLFMILFGKWLKKMIARGME